MIRYLIIEDELLACQELKRMIEDLRPDYQMAGWAQSVAQSVALLGTETFDVILADVSLSDGQCFEIFEQLEIDIPIIFTTAYDEYAIRAFKVNGVDYLLKPFEKEDLEAALSKFERHALPSTGMPGIMKLCNDTITALPKSRFLVQAGDMFRHVETTDITFFMSEDKYTYLYLFSNRKFVVNYSLDALEKVLDSTMFFRISRTCIVNIRSVTRFSRYFGGRFKLHCDTLSEKELVVSRGKAKAFLQWIDGQI